MDRLQSYPRWVKLTLTVYAVAFLIGTSTHLNVLFHGGWLPHHPFLNTYWTALTFLDPLVIFLLLRSPRARLLLALRNYANYPEALLHGLQKRYRELCGHGNSWRVVETLALNLLDLIDGSRLGLYPIIVDLWRWRRIIAGHIRS